MSLIKSIYAREVLDSRGNPTIEVELTSSDGIFSSIVPSGASTGIHEALELKDGDNSRYNGKGVLKAVNNVNTIIAKQLIKKDPSKQEYIDNILLSLDNTENKSNLGANAILGVSMAVCKAGAAAKKLPLYAHIGRLARTESNYLPIPSFNVINGGKHAGNALAFQEFMILPINAPSFSESLRYGAEIYNVLKKTIKERYGLNSVNVGDEGGFAPPLASAEEALELISIAIKEAGYEGKVRIGLDVAASEFFKEGNYNFDFKNHKKWFPIKKSPQEMIAYYQELINKYNLFSIEDPFSQDEWSTYSDFTAKFGSTIQVVGDDLLVTNPKRIKEAIEKKACNTLLLKVNQIGTITESIAAAELARQAGWHIMVSHRSGDTEDSFIADLAVGVRAEEIKSGAPCRSERLAKYNQLLRIEGAIGKKAKYQGDRISQIEQPIKQQTIG